jgi:hypothetical protein
MKLKYYLKKFGEILLSIKNTIFILIITFFSLKHYKLIFVIKNSNNNLKLN